MAFHTRRSWERRIFLPTRAPLHCARKCLDFVLDTSNRVISRRADIPWPACSPDLSPISYWFWGDLQEIVREKNPESLQEIVDIVTEAAASMERSKVMRVTQNFRRKVELYRKKKGGHFEAKVKVPKIKITEKQISISIVINKKNCFQFSLMILFLINASKNRISVGHPVGTMP